MILTCKFCRKDKDITLMIKDDICSSCFGEVRRKYDLLKEQPQ